MLEYIVNAPVEIQVILATLALIGAIVVYTFRKPILLIGTPLFLAGLYVYNNIKSRVKER